MLDKLAQNLLFKLEPETAHNLALQTLEKFPFLAPELNKNGDAVKLMGLNFSNRLGLAAGLDKNGLALKAWQRAGFGHIELGTVTLYPQIGNPKPRLFRLPEAEAIINRMGFNNNGCADLVTRVKNHRLNNPDSQIIGINIGKNKDIPNEQAIEHYLQIQALASEVADYITINISSPNTVGLRDLQEAKALENLLSALKNQQQKLAKFCPLVVKIAPDNDDKSLLEMAAVMRDLAIDGVICTNTTIDKTAVEALPYGKEAGGLSGKPLFERSLKITEKLRQALPDTAIIGVGGVFSAEDAQAKLNAGADLVQIYSGFVYRGWDLVKTSLRIKK